MTGDERRLFAGVLVVAAALASPLRGGSEKRTLDLAHALSHGRLSIDVETRGATFDRALVPRESPAALVALGTPLPRDVPFARGHVYSGGPPGHALALLPFYFVLDRLAPAPLRDLLLVILGASVPLAFAAVFVRRAVERATGCTPGQAFASAAIFALGTTALPYGTRLFGHALALALLSGALALLLAEGRPRYALAGFLAAASVVTDHVLVLPAGALFLVALRAGGAASFVLGALPPAIVLGAYDQACFGSPFATAYDHRADPEVRALLGRGVKGFVAPSPWIFLELLASGRGLAATAPVALAGLAGLVAGARERPEARLALAVALLVLLANASRALDWEGGWSYGARYSLAALPFLALGLPRGLALLGRARRPLVATSIFLAWVGATVDWGFAQTLLGNLRELVILGPRARGVTALVLGTSPMAVSTGTALVSAFVLSVAFSVAHRILRRGTRGRAVPAIVALAPWVASIPFHVRHATGGDASVRAAFRASHVTEIVAILETTRESRVARGLHSETELLGDPELVRRVDDRARELEASGH